MSPTDSEYQQSPDIPSGMQRGRGRSSHDVHQNYNDQGKFGSSSARASPYAYTSPDHSFRPNVTHEARPYGSNNERIPPSSSTLTPPPNFHYAYPAPVQMRSHTSSQSNPVYDSRVQESWIASTSYVDGQTRHQVPQSTVKPRSYSSPDTHLPWQPPPSPPSTSSSSNRRFILPTLSSPFYPSSSSLQETSVHISSSAPRPISSSPYNSHHLHPDVSMNVEYNNRGYYTSPPPNTTDGVSRSSGRGAPIFPQRQPSRGLQSSPYQQQSPHQPQSYNPTIPQDYWRS